MDTSGSTRLCATVPTAQLGVVHQALLAVLKPPVSVLYRQKIDRREPKPEGDPGKDFIALELPVDNAVAACRAASTLLYSDARCELWVRGGLQEQVVLDVDGALYCYPDDPVFRDALASLGLEEQEDLITLEKRDYVRHWFRAAADAEEDHLLATLGLTQVPVQT
jgi:hypothetical protein